MKIPCSIMAVLALMLFPPVELCAQAQSLRWPVSESITRINSGMDNNKSADIVSDYKCGNNSYDGHRGTDIGTPRNSAVYAAATGSVQARVDGFGDGYVGSQDGLGFGNHVVLFHGTNYTTIYAHFTSGTGIPAKGDTIECGAKIGASGNSGSSSGPHMHFEIRINASRTSSYSGTAVDPFSGACSTPVSYWTGLNTAEVPTTQCGTPVVAIRGGDPFPVRSGKSDAETFYDALGRNPCPNVLPGTVPGLIRKGN